MTGRVMAEVELKNVVKKYGALTVVHDFNLKIEDGEFVVFLGPSGCGKSTTLRMIAGLEDIGGGSIRIGSRDVTHLEPKDRNIAMVFQNYALYPHKTIYENMAFGLRLAKVPEQEIAKRVADAAKMLDLAELLERKPKQLSGGQMQRVALGRALVRNPDVFLLDEPLSNLDAKLRVRMREEIAALHQRIGTSMIYVTHDQVEAMTMADRIVIMRAGLIQQVGAPLEVYDRPENVFVASFIGSPEMNLLEGTISGSDAVIEGMRIPLGGKSGFADGTEIVVGIRPEHVEVGKGDLQFKVNLVEQLGIQTLCSGTCNGLFMRIMIERRDDLKSGDVLAFNVAKGKLHLFERSTGLRVTRADKK